MLPKPESWQDTTEENEQKGDIQQRLHSARTAVEQARALDSSRLAQALTTYAHLLIQTGQYAQGHSCALEALQLDSLSQTAIEALITLGICAAHTDCVDEAAAYLYQAADLSRKLDYPLRLADSLQYLVSLVLFNRGQFSLGLRMLEEASSLHETVGSPYWGPIFLRALIFQTQGDRVSCRRELDNLVSLMEPGTRVASAYYLVWARLALDEEKLGQAREYLNLGLRIANSLYGPNMNLLFRLEYSRYYRLQNEPAVAASWAEEALGMARQLHLTYYEGLAMLERAQAYDQSENLTQSQTDLEDAVQIFERLGAAYNLAFARFLKALLYQKTSHHEAEQAWLEAVRAMTQGEYAFILEKEQQSAFPLMASYLRSRNPQMRTVTEALIQHLAKVPPPLLRVATLGQFAVWKGRQRLPDSAWNRRKAGELFRYLLLQPSRAAGREMIIEALWPDHNSGNPSDLLHQATSALRHALEADLPDKFPSRYLKVEGEWISLLLPPGSVVDFEQFENLLPTALQSKNADRLQEGLSLYYGELFPSDRYDDWSADRRQFLTELYQRGLLALAQVYLEQEQFFQVINCCRQVTKLDVWNEDAVLLSMQAYAGLRDIPHAMQVYLELEKTLKNDLNLAPRLDLQELVAVYQKR